MSNRKMLVAKGLLAKLLQSGPWNFTSMSILGMNFTLTKMLCGHSSFREEPLMLSSLITDQQDHNSSLNFEQKNPTPFFLDFLELNSEVRIGGASETQQCG